MKTVFKAITVAAILTIFGCSEKENVSNPTDTPPKHSAGELVEGKIYASFIDTLSQADAESFLLARSLTVYTLTNYDGTSPYSAIIDVPAGQEEGWIDTLQKYPEVKFAGRIRVVQISDSTTIKIPIYIETEIPPWVF